LRLLFPWNRFALWVPWYPFFPLAQWSLFVQGGRSGLGFPECLECLGFPEYPVDLVFLVALGCLVGLEFPVVLWYPLDQRRLWYLTSLGYLLVLGYLQDQEYLVGLGGPVDLDYQAVLVAQVYKWGESWE
jgi:hypothetical protein